MANAQFSFMGLKRSFLTVEMPDGDKLVIAMPKKKTFEFLKDFDLEAMKQMKGVEALETMANMTATFLSNNLNGKQISTEWVEENFDTEQQEAFISAYIDFVTKGTKDPN